MHSIGQRSCVPPYRWTFSWHPYCVSPLSLLDDPLLSTPAQRLLLTFFVSWRPPASLNSTDRPDVLGKLGFRYHLPSSLQSLFPNYLINDFDMISFANNFTTLISALNIVEVKGGPISALLLFLLSGHEECSSFISPEWPCSHSINTFIGSALLFKSVTRGQLNRSPRIPGITRDIALTSF